jgi:dATP/dGTP diphosphohydrolase
MNEPGINPKDALGLKKPPLRLVPSSALFYMARVMGLGAAKYGPYNWRERKVRRSIYLEAAMRHILSALDGEDIDPESGVPHEAHAAACMGIVLDALATGNLVDDRPVKGAAARLIAEHTEGSPASPTFEGDPRAPRPSYIPAAVPRMEVGVVPGGLAERVSASRPGVVVGSRCPQTDGFDLPEGVVPV